MSEEAKKLIERYKKIKDEKNQEYLEILTKTFYERVNRLLDQNILIKDICFQHYTVSYRKFRQYNLLMGFVTIEGEKPKNNNSTKKLWDYCLVKGIPWSVELLNLFYEKLKKENLVEDKGVGDNSVWFRLAL